MVKRELTFISKSKYMEGLQCPKLLWYEYNRKELIPPPEPAKQAIFDEGTEIGEVARTLFPGGIKLERNKFPEEHDKQSREALKKRQPLFEAGFVANRGYALADVLLPVKRDSWDLIEVKSSTSVKEEHLPDIAFQFYTYRNAGLDMRSCSLMHINNEYLRKGKIDAKKLFTTEDVSAQVEDLLSSTKTKIQEMLNIIAQPNEPKIAIGPHCDSPHECPAKGHCWKHVPEHNSVFSLYRGGKLAFELMEKGTKDLCSIPEDTDLNDKQQVQVSCCVNKSSHVDRAGIRAFLNKLEYPLYFLDFETVSGGLPLYDLSRPYEQIPFQYSLHIMDKPGAKSKHYSFIAPDAADPRPDVLKRLKDLLGDKGSIVAYNASFEVSTLERSAAIYTKYAKWVDGLKDRIVDLLEPFRAFNFYHPKQEGSNSLKAVLPALTGVSYKEMEIGEGGLASREYARVTFGEGVSLEERKKVYGALEKYCTLDTQGMIDILDVLRQSCV